jgi:simple sugar transport system permease protein
MIDTQVLPYQAPAAPLAGQARPPRPWLKVLWPVVGLFLLLLIDLIFIPNFFKIEIIEGHLTGTLVTIFRYGGPEILLAVGMTIVLATGGVDLSVGAVMALAGAMIAELSTAMGWSPGMAVLAAMAIALLAGAWNGMLVTLLDIQPIVATLVLMVAGRGISTKISGAAHVDVSGSIFNVLGGSFLGLPTEGLVGVAVFALTALFCRSTSAGLMIESTGGNSTASRFAGVNVKWVTFLAYVFCGLCAGLAGLLKTAEVHGADASSMGLFWELDAILAAVIGGTALTGGRFSLIGALVGALLIETLTITIQSSGIPVEYTLVVKAIVVLVVCLLQSDTFRRKVMNPVLAANSRRSMK